MLMQNGICSRVTCQAKRITAKDKHFTAYKQMILDGMQGRTEESTLTYVFGRTDAALPFRATADAGRVTVCGFVAAPGQLPNARAGRQLLYANGHVVLAPQVGWHGEAGT